MSNELEITCPRCGKTWNYKGSSTWYACCPCCHKSISIHNIRVLKETEDLKEVDHE